MFEEQKEFYFDIGGGKKRNCILLRIHIKAMPSEPHPQILVDLLKLLENKEKISPLIKDFPKYRNTLIILEVVLSLGKATVIKNQDCDLHYSQVFGYSIYAQVELRDLSQKK